MWFRFLVISFLKWVTMFGAILALASLLPDVLSGWPLMILTWIMAFILAFLFATWAFSKRMPDRRDTLLLIAIWSLIFFTGFFVYGLIFSVRGAMVMFSIELLIQLALEIIAIFFASYSIRRRRIASLLGEGMTV